MFIRCFCAVALVAAIAFSGAAHAGEPIYLPVPESGVFLPVPDADPLPRPEASLPLVALAVEQCPGGVCQTGTAVSYSTGFTTQAVTAVYSATAGVCPTCGQQMPQASITAFQSAPAHYAVDSRPRFPLLTRLFGGLRGSRGSRCGG